VFDVSSLLQQAPAAAGPQPLAQAFDPAAVPGGAGQGAASGPPTPVHVVPIEIGLRAMAGVRQFDIRLDPDELGRVDVNLSISDKGEVSAKLVVDRVETLHLLQRDARTLERAFEQAGLKPSDGGIDISLRDPSGQPGFRQNREQDAAPERPRPADGGEPADDATLSIDPVPQRRLIRLGGVDLSI
jgi:flagellar hook-length control protein FliK